MKKQQLISVLALSSVALVGCNQTQSLVVEKTPRPIEVVELSTQQTHSIKQFSGTLQASETAELSFRVPGTIHQILVQEGQRISKGDVIARLDPHDYTISVLEIEARLSEAKAAHQLAKSEYLRVKQATQDDAIAKVNLDRALSGYKRSAAMVKVVKQNLIRANDALGYTELQAPFDGVISNQKFEQFEQAIPGISVFTLHQPNQLEAVIDVPENLAHLFQENQSANISWYQEKQIYSASLKEVGTQPHPIKQTYRVTFQLDGFDVSEKPAYLLPGKAVKVSVPFAYANNAYCLPYSALIGQKGEQKVLLANDHEIESRHVELASLDANQACINTGLMVGDKVVVTGADYLKDGDPVGQLRFVTQ